MKSLFHFLLISLIITALSTETAPAQKKMPNAASVQGANTRTTAKVSPSVDNFTPSAPIEAKVTTTSSPAVTAPAGAAADQTNVNFRARMDGSTVSAVTAAGRASSAPGSVKQGYRRTSPHPMAISFPGITANRTTFSPGVSVNSMNSTSSLGDPVSFDASIAAGGNYLRHAQSDVTEDNAGNGNPDGDNNDGGWDWVLTLPAVTHSATPSPKNIYGATAKGLYYAYLRANTASFKTAMQDAADKMVADAGVRDANSVEFLMLFNDLPGVAGTSYKDAAKAKYDAQLAAHGGTATLFAQYIRDTRGITQGYHNGIIGWDLGAWAVAAQMLYARYGGSYHSDASDIADVAYAASFVANANYFDLVRCAGWDPSYTNTDFYWYNLGVSGLIDAFRATGTHTSDIAGLVVKLQNSQATSGAICGSYGVHVNDEDWQSTAYGVMSLHALDAVTYANEINHGSYYLAATQDATGGWVYSDNTHYPEVGGECTSAMYSGQAATTVWVDDDYTSSSSGGHFWGYDAFSTIQNGIDAAGPAGTVNVYPGNYNETASNRYLFDASGPYQFGLFIGAAKSGITVQGIDGGGSPVTDGFGTLANVQTNATNSFGYSGVFVEGDNVTIAGLKILPNVPGDNKTIEVIGDNVTLEYCRFAIPPEGGSVYLDDWRYDAGTNTSHLKAYHVESNVFDDGTSVDVASGAGFSGPVSGRVIHNNTFGMPPGLPYASISFSGSGTGVPWFVYSVGGAVIAGNTFTGGEQYIRARGTYDNTQFNWASYWTGNTYPKAAVVGVNPPLDVRTYSYASGPYTFNNVRRLGASIQGELDHAVSGDKILVKAGTYAEGSPQIVIGTNVSILGEDKLTTIITPGQNTGNSGDARGWFLVNPGVTFNLSNVTLDGSGKLVNIAVLSHGPGTIDNNIFKNLGYNPGGPDYAGRAVAFYNVNMSITNNQLSNIGRIGLYANGSGVGGGIISGNTYTGKGAGDWLDYGIEVESGAHLTISNNTVTSCTGVASVDGSTSAGMLITTYFALGSQATLTGNTFSGNSVGVNVGYLGDDQSTVVAHGNVISGNADYGILTTNPFVDATQNYWGTLHGPRDTVGTIEVPRSPKPSVLAMKNAVPATQLGNRVSENVDYFPWTGPASPAARGGIWAGGYVNPVSNDIFAGVDPAASDGVDALDLVAPPPPPTDYLYLYFRTAPGQPIENYSIDIKKDEASLATTAKAWDLKAITDHNSALVTIEFPAAGLPSGFKPTLYDLATGNYQDISSNPFYTYTSPSTTTVYSFRLLMGDSTKPTVAVTAPNGGEFLVVGAPYTITWTSSDASGILAHDVYYSLTGAAPYTLIGSTVGSVHSLLWTPPATSLTASIKVVARDSVLNEQTDVSDHTFAILASNSISYAASAGWNLVSPPMLQGDMTPAGVFGDDYGVSPYYTFQFSSVSGYSVPTTLAMGQGYWLGSNSPQVVDAVGTPQSSATHPLQSGFNIIGNPFAGPLLKADLRFTDGFTVKNMADASAAGWLSNVLYKYTGSGYAFENSTLGVWQGYWIPLLTSGITIQYSPSVIVPTPKAAPEVYSTNSWQVDLTASLTTASAVVDDNVAAFGVRPDASAGFDAAYDAPRPPRSPAADFIEIGFANGNEKFPDVFGSLSARNFKTPSSAQWEFSVAASTEGTVTLRWNNRNISSLPENVRIELYDAVSHNVVDMKRTDAYTYEQTGTQRTFTINKGAENGTSATPTSFVLGQNYPNPFNPTTRISYGLPTDANVRLVVYDMLGRQVAEVVNGRQTAGMHDVSFDASALSSGMYVYTLDAIGSDGSAYHSSAKMILMK